ncbi:MAG: hypothetical protein ACQERC_03685 [Bacteroidota bacterium]
MKKVRFFIIGLSALVALTNCKKEDHEDHNYDHDDSQNKTMTVTINSPSEDQMFQLNEDIDISASISANFEMHGYEVKMFNVSNSDSLMFESFVHEHADNITASESWTNTVSAHSDVRIEVSALADHEGNERETEVVNIHCHPM